MTRSIDEDSGSSLKDFFERAKNKIKEVVDKITDADKDGKRFELPDGAEKAFGGAKQKASEFIDNAKEAISGGKGKRSLWDRITDADGDGKRFEFADKFKDTVQGVAKSFQDAGVKAGQTFASVTNPDHSQGRGRGQL